MIDRIDLVSEEQIKNAIFNLYAKHNIIAEGAAAAAFAAAIHSDFKNPIAIMTGRNIDRFTLNSIIEESKT